MAKKPVRKIDINFGGDYPTLEEAKHKVEELFGQVVALYNEG